MCVPVCKCVSACARVCALGIPPPPPLSTGGCVRPSAWSARPRPEAARPRAHRERGDGLGPALLTGGRGGSAGAAAPRRPHTPAPPQDLKETSASGAPLSGWPPPAKRGASGSTLDGAAPSQHPAARLPELLEPRGKFPGKGTQRPAGSQPGARGKGRSPRRGSYRRLAAPRAGPGLRRPSARLRAPGARAGGHAVGAGGAEGVLRCGPGRRRRRLQCRLGEDWAAEPELPTCY